MQPRVVSEKRQEFNGKVYYLCGKYFQNKGDRLHRVVWEYHNGKIPHGAHIHHKDSDRANNCIANLECLTLPEHMAERHGEASGARGRHALAAAQEAASAWHGSEEGRQWHSEHYEKCLRDVMSKRIPAICGMCGEEYMVAEVKARQGKWCGNNCKARALRKRRKLGQG